MKPFREVRSLGRELLDHQIVDSRGMLCGNVDDIEIDLDGGDAVVSALLSGPGTWAGRLPGVLAWAASHLLRDTVVRIPPEAVKGVDAAVHLDRPARELGLGTGEDRAGRWLARIPGSMRK